MEGEQSKGKYINVFIVSNVKKINEASYTAAAYDISDDEYCAVLNGLADNNQFLQIVNNHFSIERPILITSPVGQDQEEAKHMKEEIRNRLRIRQSYALACSRYNSYKRMIDILLNDPWFHGVSILPDLDVIRLSTKFRTNRLYSDFYRRITTLLEFHPLLTASFDLNAFGVTSTQLVYEYWLFYKLLFQLSAVGFRLDDNDRSGLLKHFSDFITNKQPAKKYANYVVTAKCICPGREIEIEIGYDRIFEAYDPDTQREIKRQPDYYILVKHQQENHWYFADAKYKPFVRGKGKGVNYLQEIYDVAITKYIYDMKKILDHHDVYSHYNNKICGSYIAMARSEDETVSLSETNRLFGGIKSIFSEDELKQSNWIVQELIDNEKLLPAHRYGAIVASPSNDVEIQSLIQLIFEYLESNKSDSHPNLHKCWKCGSDNITREIRETANGYQKYYVTCNDCLAFRVDNHCISCGKLIVKHTDGNYHCLDCGVTNTQWAFLCPDCGAGVNRKWQEPVNEDDDDFADEQTVLARNMSRIMMNRRFF